MVTRPHTQGNAFGRVERGLGTDAQSLVHIMFCTSQVEEEGHYVGCVKYQGQRIGPPSFTIICLNGELVHTGVHVESCFLQRDGHFVFWSPDMDAAVVEKNVSRKSLNVWYEAQQAMDKGKTKKVYCYISPKVRQRAAGV